MATQITYNVPYWFKIYCVDKHGAEGTASTPAISNMLDQKVWFRHFTTPWKMTNVTQYHITASGASQHTHHYIGAGKVGLLSGCYLKPNGGTNCLISYTWNGVAHDLYDANATTKIKPQTTNGIYLPGDASNNYGFTVFTGDNAGAETWANIIEFDYSADVTNIWAELTAVQSYTVTAGKILTVTYIMDFQNAENFFAVDGNNIWDVYEEDWGVKDGVIVIEAGKVLDCTGSAIIFGYETVA